MRHTWLAGSIAAIALAAVVLGPAVVAAEEGSKPSSGLPVGGRTRPFSVQDVTGPYKGKQLCYI